MLNTKTKKTIVLILSMVLSFTLMIPTPAIAVVNDADNNGGDVEIGTRPYVENEVIVCYIDPEDVDQKALDEEIKNPGSTDDPSDINTKGIGSVVIKPTDAEIKENLNLLDLVEKSDSLMELGEKPIDKMKGVKKGIIKKRRTGKGKVKANIGLIKNKSKKYDTEELVQKISELPNVEYAQPNYIYEIMELPTWNNQWAYDITQYEGKTKSEYGMNIPDWNKPENKNAAGTVVAVLDTGVDYNHKDLKDVMWDDGEKYTELTKLGGGTYGYNAVNSSDNPMDVGSHGTHCAGIIGAAWDGTGVSGAANGVEIMAVRAAQDEQHLSDDALFRGMNYIKKAKDEGVNVVAVNNSWGSSVPYPDYQRDTLLEEAITSLGESNVMCIFAAGNEEADCDVEHTEKNPYSYYDSKGKEQGPFYGHWQSYYYHQLSNVLTIGSNGPTGERADYSNIGKTTVDIFAPGGDYYKGSGYTGEILSTIPKDGHGYMEGTSMACPAAVGAVAILRAQNPGASMEQIRNALIKSAKKNSSKVDDLCVAGGYIDVDAALKSFDHHWSTEWTGDGKYHWHPCTDQGCTARSSIGEHIYTAISGNDNVLKCNCCDSYKYYGPALTHAEVTDSVIQNALKTELSKAFESEDIKTQYINIDIAQDIPSSQSKKIIVIPYAWISNLPAGITMEQLEHYTFAVVHRTSEGVVETLEYVVTDQGIEVKVSELGAFAVGFVKEPAMKGDLNGDYSFTKADVQLLCQGLTKNTLTNDQIAIADMNNDKEIDVNDAIILRNKVA